MLTARLEEFLDAHVIGVLATAAPGGRPLQSVVYYAREGQRLMISSVSGRRKVSDVADSGWASLCVVGGERPFPSATFSGPAEILTRGIGEATAAVAQRLLGAEEPPEPQSDEALAEVGRVIIALTIARVSAVNYLDGV